MNLLQGSNAIPTGTITFLFTDIEGSTKLWEAQPQAMQASLARHDALLREAIEAHNGYVFKTVGDAFCAAFTTAPEAIQAAFVGQLALVSEPWPELTPIKVRMALHTGAVEHRDGDYFGQPLNRVARLLAIGHGGQTILSLAATELVRDSLPIGMTLRSLGEHRLKDLGRPESVFQLGYPGLPSEFSPLKSLDNLQLRHNLPQQVTSFVGREKELAQIRALLAKTHLLTLTGSGGCGKTRLALQVAAEMLDGDGDGVWLVELAPLTDPSLVVTTVAGALNVKEEPGKPILQTLTEHLKSKHPLLVLDNCEHLLDACAKLADTLMRQCPRVQLLASSREALGISGELTYRVPSLSLPDPNRHQTPESLTHFEAVQLFLERALFHQPTFAVTNANASSLASICHRLDGIPLAIELAAARVRSLSVEDINSKLDQRFRLLMGGSRAALPRQQTLRSLIDWSYDLLSEVEKALLCRLSVFAGGWTLESAEQVCSGDPVEDWEVLELLSSLCDKSLVVSEPASSSTRYRFLETVRQYARDRLMESGGGAVYRGRHLSYYMDLVKEAEPQLMGPNQVLWLNLLEREHDNLRAALEWSSDSGFDSSSGLRLSSALSHFWQTRGYLSEGRERLSRTLAGEPGDALLRAKALNGLGGMAYSQGDYISAREFHEESLTICGELGEQGGIAYALQGLGIVASVQGDYASSHTLFAKSLTILREISDQGGIAKSLQGLGVASGVEGDYGSSRIFFEESLAILRDIGDQRSIAYVLNGLGDAAGARGDYGSARAFFEESLAILRELGDRLGIAWGLLYLGCVDSATGLPVRASQLWGAAERLFEELGAALSERDQQEQEKEVSSARATLNDDAAFASAWAVGRALTMEAAIELGLEKTEY